MYINDHNHMAETEPGPGTLNAGSKSIERGTPHRQNFKVDPSITTRKIQQLCATMLYFIGLGLADEKDITVKGLEIVQKAERVYLEAYTAVLLVEKEKLVIPSPVLNQVANTTTLHTNRILSSGKGSH